MKAIARLGVKDDSAAPARVVRIVVAAVRRRA
jgi:hypothetical protein